MKEEYRGENFYSEQHEQNFSEEQHLQGSVDGMESTREVDDFPPCPDFRGSWLGVDPVLVWKPASWRHPVRWVWEAPKGSAGLLANGNNAARDRQRNAKRK